MNRKATAVAEKETFSSEKDHELGRRIIENLKSNVVADLPTRLEIRVAAGAVHLYGKVLMQAEKQMVEEIVRLTNGVCSVVNHLDITPCAGKRRR